MMQNNFYFPKKEISAIHQKQKKATLMWYNFQLLIIWAICSPIKRLEKHKLLGRLPVRSSFSIYNPGTHVLTF